LGSYADLYRFDLNFRKLIIFACRIDRLSRTGVLESLQWKTPPTMETVSGVEIFLNPPRNKINAENS
jgi:hypothetical protein